MYFIFVVVLTCLGICLNFCLVNILGGVMHYLAVDNTTRAQFDVLDCIKSNRNVKPKKTHTTKYENGKVKVMFWVSMWKVTIVKSWNAIVIWEYMTNRFRLEIMHLIKTKTNSIAEAELSYLVFFSSIKKKG